MTKLPFLESLKRSINLVDTRKYLLQSKCSCFDWWETTTAASNGMMFVPACDGGGWNQLLAAPTTCSNGAQTGVWKRQQSNQRIPKGDDEDEHLISSLRTLPLLMHKMTSFFHAFIAHSE